MGEIKLGYPMGPIYSQGSFSKWKGRQKTVRGRGRHDRGHRSE